MKDKNITAITGYLGGLGIDMQSLIDEHLQTYSGTPVNEEKHTCTVYYNDAGGVNLKYIKVSSPSGGYCIIHEDEFLKFPVSKGDQKVYDYIGRVFTEKPQNPQIVDFTYDEMQALMQFAWETDGTVCDGKGNKIVKPNNNA